MAVLPEEIPTGTLKGQFYFVNEDSIDPDTNPELTVVQGFVRCIASVKSLRMASKKAIVIPLRFDAKFDGQGNLVPANGTGVGMEMPAVDSPLFDTTGWYYTAHFELVEVETGFTVNLKPIEFQIFEGQDTDLSDVIPIEKSPGVITTRGIQGEVGPKGVDGSNVIPTAEAVAYEIGTPGTLAHTELTATIGENVSKAIIPEVTAAGVVSIIGGQVDEVLTVSGATASADTATKRIGTQSWKVEVAASGTVTVLLPALTTGETLVEKIAAVGAMIHLADASKVTTITMQLYTDAGSVNYYNFSVADLRGGVAGNLKTGWNIPRWTPEFGIATGAPAAWGTIHHARLVFVTNAATTINVQQVFAEVRPKASMLFIHDGGYKAWDQSPGYHDLRDRDIPVTWSVDCALIGDATHVTDARLREVGAENRNSIGFHGWDSTSTAAATAATLQAHTMKAIKWLARRGFTGRIWRSAWLQNTAANSPATDAMVVANPYYGAHSGNRTQNAWPFMDRHNVLRIAIQGKTTAQIDALFAQLERDHGVLVCYTHNVNNLGNPADATTTEWAYFLGKVDAAMAAGWLEGTTLEMLLASSGLPIRRGLGGALTVEWPNVDGTTDRMYLP